MEPVDDEDPFLRKYQPSDLKIASEFLTTWLPFLSRDLCSDCVHVLSRRIRSLDSEHSCNNNTETVSRDEKPVYHLVVEDMDSEETDHNRFINASETASPKMSWDDMTQEDGLNEEEQKVNEDSMRTPQKRKLSRDEREQYRFINVKRMKVFSCYEKVKGRRVDILDGLELHTGVFSAAEQKRIVDYVYELQEKGRKGELQG
ncbi:hypothetical protein F2Q69_00032792 [Brassica cretica]|uniref:Uncharacterized protein n=1 Tax=Brassica cretica TaxID=69181 RepID=A0A8S9SBM2_BRACR|nr:hypothetical protein F2Q69_00032792 [Brassica cretica]